MKTKKWEIWFLHFMNFLSNAKDRTKEKKKEIGWRLGSDDRVPA
jgi:hypothetical protein